MKKIKVYPFPIDPEKYAWFDKRPFPVVTSQALENKIQFTSLRGFPSEADTPDETSVSVPGQPQKGSLRLLQMEEMVDMYVHHFKLGKVLWPFYLTLYASNFNDLVDLCVRDGLYLYDFFGFVPGSSPVGNFPWGEYAVPEEADAYMRETLGDHFLGYDNGEQDGRYTDGRARQQASISNSREAQYELFQSYFQKLNDSMRNHTVTLASLTFLPYFAREGNTIMLGAETAQGLPGNNMWFSFIRGAGKQYGILYYGNASVFNNWGHKAYRNTDADFEMINGREIGRCAGASLSLLKRLMYNQWMYGCNILGFEQSWFFERPREDGDVTDRRQYVMGDKVHVLTPVGDIQQKCAEFIEKHGTAGVMHTPVAMMLDFHAGWVPPRQHYVRAIYKVWGSLPYNIGDYQVHCFMSMLYPHYEDSGFYRNEQGFETATPYGEIMDVLMSDARIEVLKRYPILLLTRGVKLTKELQHTIKCYAEAGGTVIAFAGAVKQWNAEALFGVKALIEKENGEYEATLCSHAQQNGMLVTSPLEAGELRLILHEHGLEPTGEELTARNEPNEPICQPYRITKKVEDILAAAYNQVQLLKVNNPSLQYLTSVRSKEEYTFMVASSQPQTESFDILSAVGPITSIVELETTDGVEALKEFLPLQRSTPGNPVCSEGAYTIDPGCIRLFRITVKDAQVTLLEESNPEKLAQSRTGKRYVTLPTYVKTAKRAVLDQPTLQHHFDGIVLPARYLENMDTYAVENEAHYMNLQKVHILVDFGDMINVYPDLPLIGNIKDREEEVLSRIGAILNKAKKYLCDGIILCAHRNAETNYTMEQTEEGFARIIGQITQMSGQLGIPLLMKNRIYTSLKPEITAFDTAGALVDSIYDMPDTTQMLLLSRPLRDSMGQLYTVNLPVSSGEEEALTQWANAAKEKGLPIVLAAEYTSWDDIFADIQWLDG